MNFIKRTKYGEWPRYEDVKELIGDLRANKTPDAVLMWGKRLSGRRAAALGDALAGNVSLNHLRLWSCNIGVEGAAAIGRALSSNATLLGLYIGDDGSVGDEGAKRMAEGIAKSRSLKEIELYNCKVGAEGSVALGKVLGESQTLEGVSIAFNDIGDEGAYAITEGVIKSRCLKKIDLRSCQIRHVGAVALGKAFGGEPDPTGPEHCLQRHRG